MPRQDVPYGGAICRLRERIAEIFDKLGEKLHTINGVPGDGDGNVKIVSGSSAVVISNDPTQNEISVALDTSQLPAAAVSSVNGQTGAVALDAGDIPTVGGDVQADLQDLANDISGNTAAINAEVLARQGADSTLQTNINTVTASLPSAAAAAVAADPTVAYISSELSNKVDLSDVSTVETPDTIAKRNGSGRLVAADPASGATDKTLVTANWVSQTGAGRPNNVIHDTGNETKTGEFTVANLNNNRQSITLFTGDPTGWKLVYKFPYNTALITLLIRGRTGNRRNGSPIIATIAISSPSQIGDGTSWNAIDKLTLGASSTKRIGVAVRSDNTIGIYYDFPGSEYTQIEMLGTCNIGNSGPMDIRTTMTQEDPTTFTQYMIA